MEIMGNGCTALRWVIEEHGDLEHLLAVGGDHLGLKYSRCGSLTRSRTLELVMVVQEA